MIDLLRYMLWLKTTNCTPSTTVTDTELDVNVNSSDLTWTKSRKYTGTSFSLVDGELIATAPTGSDVEDMEIDEDGYVIVTEEDDVK